MAERTKAPLISQNCFTGRGSGWNPFSAKIHYLLSFREFKLMNKQKLPALSNNMIKCFLIFVHRVRNEKIYIYPIMENTTLHCVSVMWASENSRGE